MTDPKQKHPIENNAVSEKIDKLAQVLVEDVEEVTPIISVKYEEAEISTTSAKLHPAEAQKIVFSQSQGQTPKIVNAIKPSLVEVTHTTLKEEIAKPMEKHTVKAEKIAGFIFQEEFRLEGHEFKPPRQNPLFKSSKRGPSGDHGR